MINVPEAMLVMVIRPHLRGYPAFLAKPPQNSRKLRSALTLLRDPAPSEFLPPALSLPERASAITEEGQR